MAEGEDLADLIERRWRELGWDGKRRRRPLSDYLPIFTCCLAVFCAAQTVVIVLLLVVK